MKKSQRLVINDYGYHGRRAKGIFEGPKSREPKKSRKGQNIRSVTIHEFLLVYLFVFFNLILFVSKDLKTL